MKSRIDGFTLTEVLAVIAIIAATSALVFPAFSQSKRGAKRIVCTSGLHNIGVGTDLYLGDYDDHYPKCVNAFEREHPDITMGRNPEDDPMVFPTPVESLSPYLGDPRPFICPMDTGADIGVTLRAHPVLYRENGGSSFLFAELFTSQSSTSWSDPSKQIWACDGSPAWHSPHFDPMIASTFLPNALFYDGHVALARSSNAPDFLP